MRHLVKGVNVLTVGVVLLITTSCATDDDLSVPDFIPDITLAMELGHNEVGAPMPEGYQAMAAEDPVPVMLGAQGAWMVVAVCQVESTPTVPPVSKVDVEIVDVETGAIYADASLRNRPTVVGVDGLTYIPNLFVVVDDAQPWEGRRVRISIKASLNGAGTAEHTAEVILMRRDD